ncbi:MULTISPECIES: hypothetical protein [unclassified Ruegeria]|uniref:hypothetical protein n=1 Tax=unclassified Ruegeria TaxID=2625375 RepID=UPI001AEAA4BD|nr:MULTISPECIES: hypothetical protein [unclassified Ruegeria]
MFALTSLTFSVPVYFLDSVNMEYNNGFSGEAGKYTTPGSQLIVMLFAFPFAFGFFGAVLGWQARKQRQLTLLAASNPLAPEYLKKKSKTRFLDQTLYRLNVDGTDMQVSGIKND